MSFTITGVSESYGESGDSCAVTIELHPEAPDPVGVTFSFGRNEQPRLYYRNIESDVSQWTEDDIDVLSNAKDRAKEEPRERLGS